MLEAYLGMGVVALALGFGGGWVVHGWKADAETHRRDQAASALALDDSKRMERSAEHLQAGNAAAERREQQVIKEVIRVVQKPVYRDVCLDDDGLRILAADVEASNARRGLAPALPASGPAE